ncbi:MAG: hypothetical protein RL261_1105 [Pseudomonadota bacterium]
MGPRMITLPANGTRRSFDGDPTMPPPYGVRSPPISIFAK